METENKILYYNIKELKNKQKKYQKKINDHQNQLDFLENKSKEKQQEIQILTEQRNELKKINEMGIDENDDSKIKELIKKIIEEKEKYKNKKQTSNDNENSKENNQKCVTQKESEIVNQKE